jgi:MerR family mercuric resistance operon transcriptional regulator
MEPSLSIGQLASATGLAAKTIRYYEQMGVLPAPRRNAAGYRQYERRDVHRTLFIRRARALGIPLGRLKTLTSDLNGRPSRTLRPRLYQVATEHLRAVREQIADFQVLEQQLEQVLQRLRTIPSAKHSEACHCLDGSATPMSQQTPHRPPTRKRGGADMNSHSTIEAMTRLAVVSNADCGCGCSCAGRGALPVKPQELPLLPLDAAASAETEVRRRPRPDGAVDLKVRRG